MQSGAVLLQVATPSALPPEEIVARVRAQMAYDVHRNWNNDDWARLADALLRWAVTAEEFVMLEGGRTLDQWIEHLAGEGHNLREDCKGVPRDLPALVLNRENGESMHLQRSHLAYLLVPWQDEYGLVVLARERQEDGEALALSPLNSSLLIQWAGQCEIPAHYLAQRIFRILHVATLGSPRLYEVGLRLLRLRAELRQLSTGQMLFW